VLLFSDPKEFAQQGRNQKYPDSWWMPGMAVQSGTVYLDSGDPLTPYYPSIGTTVVCHLNYLYNSVDTIS